MNYVFPFIKPGLVLWLLLFLSPGLLADNTKKDKQQHRSELFNDNAYGYNKTSFPAPFTEIGNPVTAPAVSTGYYFVDSDDDAGAYWHPVPLFVDTNNTYAGTWVRIESGPRQRNYSSPLEAASRWADPDDWGGNGYTFFRNPAYPIESSGASYFNHGFIGATDSTDNAIAGPMPIFISDGFYFNGIRYDSFYVSTNGLICLTNRRYYYDDVTGLRKVEGDDCYDPMSMDWYVGSSLSGYDRTRSAEGSANSIDPAIEPVEDNFGYYVAVLGTNQWNPKGGIRKAHGALNELQPYYKAAVIAPFFGDLQLSQWHESANKVDDHGQVWFRKYTNGDTLCIYFVNAAPVNTAYYKPDKSFEAAYDLRPTDGNYISASAQVLLCRRDSSIVINYETFNGMVSVNGRGYPAKNIFRYSTTCGVRGFARHQGYHHVGGIEARGESAEYEQYTYYFDRYQTDDVDYPKAQSAVKFKQWKNTLRVVEINYRVRSLDVNDDLLFTQKVNAEYTDNFELLAGEDRIGALQPVAIYQNLTNEIQGPKLAETAGGINFHEQELNFQAIFRIMNETSGKPIYNRIVPVDSFGLAIEKDNRDLQNDYFNNPNVKVDYVSIFKDTYGTNITESLSFPGADNYNGIPPYGFVEVYFPPYEPNEYIESQLGRLKGYAIAVPKDPENMDDLGAQWPFDDTSSVTLHSMRIITKYNNKNTGGQFIDEVTEFYNVNGKNIPSVLNWVNIGGEVIQGDSVSKFPAAPAKEWDEDSGKFVGYKAANDENIELFAPVIKLDRINDYGICDEIRSYPIDLRDRENVILSLSVQRGTYSPDQTWDRGWADEKLVGPEPRCIVNGDPFNVFNQSENSASYIPDALVVEFAKSSPDQVHGITNIGQELSYIPQSLRGSWRYHPRRGGARPVTNNAAYTLFGGGGCIRGFLEDNKDSALALPQYPYGPANGLRPDIYDSGIDPYFKKIHIPVPDTFISSPNEAAKNFRFRIRVDATDDQKCETCIPDDEDPFYIDNVYLLFPTESFDLEMTSIQHYWPYTTVPLEQAIQIPMYVTVSNNSLISSAVVGVALTTGHNRITNWWVDSTYQKSQELPYIPAASNMTVIMPEWCIRSMDTTFIEYELLAYFNSADFFHPGSDPIGDINYNNNMLFSKFRMNVGDVISYDPLDARNDVPAFSGDSGRGLNLPAYSEGGYGSFVLASNWDEEAYSYGLEGSGEGGEIAMKFKLFRPDTIYGYQAFFGSKSTSHDPISFRVYTDTNDVPGEVISTSVLANAERGRDDIRDDYFYDEYVTCFLPRGEPLILPRGTYWLAIEQPDDKPIHLGGSKSKMGMRTLNINVPPPMGGYVGAEGNQLLLNNDMKIPQDINTGHPIIVNQNFFAYRNAGASDGWKQFIPEVGNPAYAHLHHFGVSPVDGQTWTLSRGTWIPMLRPFFKDPVEIPVELIGFDGHLRESSVDLFWETASEINNYGFYIERRVIETASGWQDIGFVAGSGTTNKYKSYHFNDDHIEAGNTYQYRLKQVDYDGTENRAYSDIVTITVGSEALNVGDIIVLGNPDAGVYEAVSPNPITNSAHIRFQLNSDEFVQAEILDILGNVVNTIASRQMQKGSKYLQWKCDFSDGRKAPAGRYILRITAGNEVRAVMVTRI